MVYIGQTVSFAASGGGTIRWGGDAPGVATIDQTTGAVTGIAIGRVTIWAENSAGRTIRMLRVLPSYAGNWQGSWVVERCEQDGVFSTIDFCLLHPAGQTRDLRMAITQTEDRIPPGGIAFGAVTGTMSSATVGEDGQARLTATMTSVPGSEIRITVDNLVLNSPSVGVVEGTLEQVWSSVTLPGSMRLYGRVSSLTRSSDGPTLLLLAPPSGATTYRDIDRLLSAAR